MMSSYKIVFTGTFRQTAGAFKKAGMNIKHTAESREDFL